MSTSNTNCLFCKIDLTTRKNFDTAGEILFCSSKCRKDATSNASKMKKYKSKK